MSKITDFYNEDDTDHKDRDFSDIIGFSFKELETVHDYIQWLFPLKEPSQSNAKAPILTDADIAAFKKDEILQINFRKSFEMMLEFYGLEQDSDSKAIGPADDLFAKAIANWLTRGNHNFMRITRILKSMSLLGLKEDAQEFFKALDIIYKAKSDIISETTYEYWKKAVAA
jgi:Opioid growth factor receptor (OGFr) conserved region